ncbi:helix-turn-helix domain-containing protein [Leptospira meyeri]|uniref:helix-turn-helix domain-containing protein n=1 Tax=Leptospira meyeri TaxID=29508 RepID=UPI001AEF75AE|nr:helix-turn-helix domain-containing protein [Leptospira meyeri]
MATLLLGISLLFNLFFLFGNRHLLLKITFLKSQLTAYKRKEKVFHTKTKERIFLILISYLLPNWESSLILVSPNTLLKWRKKKFQLFWKLLSQRKKPGRPNIPWDLIKLIRRLAKENRIWGATKLHGILIKLGLVVSERTVSRYIPKRPIDPSKRLSWNQFYSLHSDSLIVSDLFSVISYKFKEIYKVIFFMDLQTRKILHFDIHTNPTTKFRSPHSCQRPVRVRLASFGHPWPRLRDDLFTWLRKESVDVCLGASNPLVDKCFYLETTALFATIFPMERISAAIAGAGDWFVNLSKKDLKQLNEKFFIKTYPMVGMLL